MQLFLQMGHGMQKLALDLISKWNGGSVIISPSNFKNPGNESVIKYAKQIHKINGSVLFDPQMFYPKDGHEKLKAYDYWVDESSSITSETVYKKIDLEILRINNEIDSSHIIVPGIDMNESNLSYGINWLKSSVNHLSAKTDKPLLGTICLSSEAIRNDETVEKIIDEIKDIPVYGYYIIARPTDDDYINTDYRWLTGMMKLITCIKLLKKYVLVGYSNHQSLLYSLANVDAIAAGTYMNTRCFVPDKFKSYKDNTIKKKSTWFYVPSALCEYKAALIDLAKARNFLDLFEPQGEFINEYSSMLFKGAHPSSTNYSESNSFRHYLYCLNIQCNMLSNLNYQDTFSAYEFMLRTAENQMATIKKKGIGSQNRDFEPAIEANRIAMITNDEDYGFRLNIDWN